MLEGKTTLITGASAGIGRAIAQLFARKGARVALNFRSDRNAAERTLSSLEGGSHILAPGDISNPGLAQSLVEKVVSEFGRLDVLVNNAGIFIIHPIKNVAYEEWLSAWNLTIGTNLTGAANVSYWAIQAMLKTGGGRIVNISSRGAFRGEPESPAYGASKAGMNAMSQSLAKALAPLNIYVFSVAPGFVSTERILSKHTPEKVKELNSQSPLGRMTSPDEVAEAVLFLAAVAPPAMTGSIIDVNGASYLRT